jgi:hypothetical protein
METRMCEDITIRWGPTRGSPTLGLLRGLESKVSWLIRVLTTFRGEVAAVVNHVLVVCKDLATIVESTATGTRRGKLVELYAGAKVWGVLLELVEFSEEHHDEIQAKAERYEGEDYGWAAIAKQAVDGVLGFIFGRDVYLVRRLRLPWTRPPELYNICSWLGCWSHKLGDNIGWCFRVLVTRYRKEGNWWRPRVRRETVREELPCERAAPDCLWKAAFDIEPWRYIVRAEVNPELRPDDLPRRYEEKIDHDIETGVPWGDHLTE